MKDVWVNQDSFYSWLSEWIEGGGWSSEVREVTKIPKNHPDWATQILLWEKDTGAGLKTPLRVSQAVINSVQPFCESFTLPLAQFRAAAALVQEAQELMSIEEYKQTWILKGHILKGNPGGCCRDVRCEMDGEPRCILAGRVGSECAPLWSPVLERVFGSEIWS